jgi:tripartite-type tricarboxylate transporter receptor subunit TctC
MDLAGWSAMFAPRGTPPEILERVARDVKEAIADPALQKIFNDFDIKLGATTPAAFAVDIKRQYEVWGKLIREAAVKGE